MLKSMMMWGGFPFLMVHYLGWLYSDPCLLEMGPIYGLEKHNFGTCQMVLGFGVTGSWLGKEITARAKI